MSDNKEIYLSGGRANSGQITRIGNEVARPNFAQSDGVNHFLRWLTKQLDIEQSGLQIPEPLGVDENGRQRYRYVEGVTVSAPLPHWVLTDDILIEIAKQQRLLHRAARGYIAPKDIPWAQTAGDYFPKSAFITTPPSETTNSAQARHSIDSDGVAGGGTSGNYEGLLMCHNDLSVSNIVFNTAKTAVVGIIDFDYVRPVSRLFDIAVALRHWIPFGNLDIAATATPAEAAHAPPATVTTSAPPATPESAETPAALRADLSDRDRFRRYRLFCDIHELDSVQRQITLDLTRNFLTNAASNVAELAKAGNAGFIELIENGYLDENAATLKWIETNSTALIT